MSEPSQAVSPIQPGWRRGGLIGLNLAALLILLSWLWPVTRVGWDWLDYAGFAWLNGSLSGNPLWSGFWALTSLRLFDLASAGIMLLLLLYKDWLFSADERVRALCTFVALLIVLLVWRGLFTKLVVAYGWQHHSPSLQIAGSIRLSELYPWLNEHLDLKDASKRSFPGDHASVSMLWGLFMALFARKGKLLVIGLLTMLMVLPRLMAGAHWISDDLVGGLILTLLALAWGYCTPLAGLIARPLQRVAEPVLRWPLVVLDRLTRRA